MVIVTNHDNRGLSEKYQVLFIPTSNINIFYPEGEAPAGSPREIVVASRGCLVYGTPQYPAQARKKNESPRYF